MFDALMNRHTQTTGWQKIPWHEPDFSRRMLAEHLNQNHDAASRRATIIDRHVTWIQRKVLADTPAHILDLGCGPGFYALRLSDLGHTVTGIDIGPASVEYARAQHPGGTYILGDIRSVEYGSDYDLVMLVYGELNAFAPEDARRIVAKAHAALKPGGVLLLEVHPYAYIYDMAQRPSTWYTTERGLFGDAPYLCLSEHYFDMDHVISHDYVFPIDGGTMRRYTSMHHAYGDDDYRHLLAAFTRVSFYPTLTGDADGSDLFAIVAVK